jgi:phosphoesterase RecJ-like protein
MISWLENVKNFIKEADHFLVVSHVHPDGDAVSSTLATARILRECGKKVTMVNESPIPKKFSFLPGMGEILQPHEVKEKFQYVVTVDCADAKRVGECADLYADQVKILNIDHHATNDHFGTVNVVIPDSAATVEILFDWIEGLQINWDQELAMMIYTGLLTDTGGFRYSNTTPKLLRQAAQLLEVGIEAHRITDVVLETTTMEQLQLLQVALSTLKRSEDGLVAWMTLQLTDMKQYNATSEDLDGIVNYARNIAGVDVGILFREEGEQTVKVSFRSRARADVATVAKSIGGGGHARAAGCTYQGTIEEAQAEILPLVFKELESGEK